MRGVRHSTDTVSSRTVPFVVPHRESDSKVYFCIMTRNKEITAEISSICITHYMLAYNRGPRFLLLFTILRDILLFPKRRRRRTERTKFSPSFFPSLRVVTRVYIRAESYIVILVSVRRNYSDLKNMRGGIFLYRVCKRIAQA